MSKSTPIQNVVHSQIPDPLENDETIQEVLQSLGAQPQQQQLQSPPLQQSQQQQQQYQYQSLVSQAHQAQQNPYLHYQSQNAPNVQIYDKFSLSLFWDKDARAAFVVATLYAVLMIIPIEMFVYKYLNVEHIPYSSIVVKSVCAAIAYYVISKLWF